MSIKIKRKNSEGQVVEEEVESIEGVVPLESHLELQKSFDDFKKDYQLMKKEESIEIPIKKEKLKKSLMEHIRDWRLS
jgi:hypothetical protein